MEPRPAKIAKAIPNASAAPSPTKIATIAPTAKHSGHAISKKNAGAGTPPFPTVIPAMATPQEHVRDAAPEAETDRPQTPMKYAWGI